MYSYVLCTLLLSYICMQYIRIYSDYMYIRTYMSETMLSFTVHKTGHSRMTFLEIPLYSKCHRMQLIHLMTTTIFTVCIATVHSYVATCTVYITMAVVNDNGMIALFSNSKYNAAIQVGQLHNYIINLQILNLKILNIMHTYMLFEHNVTICQKV